MLPYSTTLPGVGGRLRVEAEDFVVEEIPAYAAAGEGQHLLLWIEKRNTSHEGLVQHLAERLGITRRQIGTAGMKDRRAITRQYVSVPAEVENCLAGVVTDSIDLLRVARHRHKLRTGHLRGNRFSVIVRGIEPEAYEAAVRIQQALRNTGVLNFFGPQRFGIAGRTLQQGLELMTGQQLVERLPRKRRDFLLRLGLSAVQSELFNQLVTLRFRRGFGRTVLGGDVMQVVASGGPFQVEDPTAEQNRFDAGETVIAGPLFGAKMLPARDLPAQLEAEILQANGLGREDFERFPKLTRGARRAIWTQPQGLEISAEPDGLRFNFSLPAGSYATVVMREYMKVDESDEEPT